MNSYTVTCSTPDSCNMVPLQIREVEGAHEVPEDQETFVKGDTLVKVIMKRRKTSFSAELVSHSSQFRNHYHALQISFLG